MFTGGGVEPPAKGPVHRFGCSETARLGDLFDGPVGALKEPACRVEPDRFDVVRCGGTDLGLEDTGELALGEVDLPGERRDGQVVGEVVAQPGQQVAYRFGVGGLSREKRGELSLTS